NVLYYGFCPDRNVKSFLNHVYSPVRRLDEDRDLWVNAHIAGERMSQTPLRQQDWAAEPNEPRRLPSQFGDGVIRRLRSLDRCYTSFKEALSVDPSSSLAPGARHLALSAVQLCSISASAHLPTFLSPTSRQ